MTSLLGLLIVGLAGALNGTYALPLKRTTRWAWENTWLVYSAVGMLAAAWAVALLTVPQLPAVYADAGLRVLVLVCIFGMLWGIANFLFGRGIDLLGISLTFPIAIGMSLALGSLVTMVAKDAAAILSPGGLVTVLGILVVVGGVSACAIAGVLRDRQSSQATAAESQPEEKPRWHLVLGLAVVLAAGLLDPMLNFAFHFGGPIETAAASHGADPLACSDALWVWPLLGSFAVNTLYCSYLLTRNQTWSRFWASGTLSHWALAGLMGIIWMGSITLYGRGASMMGTFGKSLGWAVFYCAIILFSGLWGIVCGEWNAARGRPLCIMVAGLAMLLAALLILAYGNYLFEPVAQSIVLFASPRAPRTAV